MSVLYRSIFIFWFIVLLVIAGLLFSEYRYFKTQNIIIQQKHNEYFNKFLLLKSLVDKYKNLHLELKKKATIAINNRDEENAGLVNRKLSSSLINEISIKQNPKINKWHKFQKQPIFKWPLKPKQYWISSLFGARRKANGKLGFHHGIDLAAFKGTPVYAALNGIVLEAGFLKGYGNTIVIRHQDKYKNFKTRYAHLDKVMIAKNQYIKSGQKIGEVGDTGFVRKKGTDASHLHFEVYLNNKRVNPLYFLA